MSGRPSAAVAVLPNQVNQMRPPAVQVQQIAKRRIVAQTPVLEGQDQQPPPPPTIMQQSHHRPQQQQQQQQQQRYLHHAAPTHTHTVRVNQQHQPPPPRLQHQHQPQQPAVYYPEAPPPSSSTMSMSMSAGATQIPPPTSTPDTLAAQLSNVDVQDWDEQKSEKKQRTQLNSQAHSINQGQQAPMEMITDNFHQAPPLLQQPLQQPLQLQPNQQQQQQQPLVQHIHHHHQAQQQPQPPQVHSAPSNPIQQPQQIVQLIPQPLVQTPLPLTAQVSSMNQSTTPPAVMLPATLPLLPQHLQHDGNPTSSGPPIPIPSTSTTSHGDSLPQLVTPSSSNDMPVTIVNTEQTVSRRRRNPHDGFDESSVQQTAAGLQIVGDYMQNQWRLKDKLSKAQRDKLSRLIAEANMLQGRHKFHDAIAVFDQVLNIDPNNITALNSKGVCYKYIGDNVQAMGCYQRALEIKPDDWTAHNNRGVIFKDAGLFQEAIDCYKFAIQYGAVDCIAKTNMAIVLTDLGTTLKLAGSVSLAVQKYHEALHFNPNYVSAYFNLGVVYSESNQFEEALKYYMLSVEKNPTYVEALCNIGVIFKNNGKLEEAIQYYQRALQANPNFEIANNNIAIAYTDMGTKRKNANDIDGGIRYYKQALLHNSKYADAWYNLGVAYAEKRELADSVICYETAVAWKPKCAEAYNNLGVIYKERGNLQKAVIYYQKALRANPNFAHTLNNLGVIYTMMGKLEEAYAYCHQAIQVNPTYAEAYNNLGVLYRDEGRIKEAIKSYEDCLAIDVNSRNAGQNRLLAMNYLPDLDMDEVTEAHREWGIHFAKHFSKYEIHENDISDSNRPIRIGYISPDFFAHSVSYFIEAPLTNHNREKCEIFCYSNVVKEDHKTLVLKKFAHNWRDIHGFSSVQVCELVRQDKIDILVELTGHTAGNRLDVMSHRPCPVQVTWIGYPNSTGLPTVDYRIADSVTDPPETKQNFIESLVRLPNSFLCYRPPRNVPEVSEVPAIKNKFVTFGSFNNLAKIHTQVLTLWATILNMVPHSRMLMKCKPFASDSVKNKVLDAFSAYGIASKRIDLLPLLPSTADHMRAYSMVDIALDTFPYAGTTTTCEAMYMGVPVVTLGGEVHAQNVGVSLLKHSGYDCLIAQTEEQYVNIAVRIATTTDNNGDLSELKDLRDNMRQNMLNSSLCDGKTFTVGLEETFRKMWRTHCETRENENHAALDTLKGMDEGCTASTAAAVNIAVSSSSCASTSSSGDELTKHVAVAEHGASEMAVSPRVLKRSSSSASAASSPILKPVGVHVVGEKEEMK